MRRDPLGYFSLVLHAHLPFVRDPKHERFLEENWFYEALSETYLPLLLMFEDLIRDGVDFRVTVCLSPTLLAMFSDGLLQERYERRLDGHVELAEKEVARHRRNGAFLELARFYHERFSALRDYYLEACGRDLTAGFRRLQEMGRLEVVPTAATHGYLPLLRHEPSAVEAQIRVAVEDYRQRFGRDPQGFWLPECGFYPGLDEVLARHGLRYFFVETHGVLQGSTRAHYGAYAPVVTPAGVAAFPRDPECSRQVWSAEDGFPGDPDYREFYRDIGFDLPLAAVGPYIGPDGIRIQTGIKYYRVTGRTDQKQLYVRAQAMRRAAEHAALFLGWRQKQALWLAGRMDRRPIIVAPYDAELFGHWWFEGPEWINFLLRKIAFDQDTITSLTPSEYLAEYPEAQESMPSPSSWGRGGYSDMWLNGACDWVYPRLHHAARSLSRLANRHRGVQGQRRRLLNQAGRELLLAQASDWPFNLKTDRAAEYAGARLREHLGNFDRLVAPLERGAETSAAESPAGKPAVDAAFLDELEGRNNIFPALQFEVFEDRVPRGPSALVANPRHVAFLSAEAAPYVKVGGLADVAGALPAALARLGLRVTLVIPAYRSVDRGRHGVTPYRDGLSLLIDSEPVRYRILAAREPAPGVRVLLIDGDGFFDRPGVYVDPATGEEYADTARRFTFFTKAALEALRVLGEPVDIVHSHDHQTALAGSLLKIQHRKDPVLGLGASVYTLHNLGYQGVYEPEVLDLAGLGRELARPGSPFEHRGKVNFMKVGIQFADKVNTVSEGYAREICDDPEGIGAGLGEELRARRRDFAGILNGIDVCEWDPEHDPYLSRPYSAADLAGKRQAKGKLVGLVGLGPGSSDAPLIGMITRLVDQKGLDLLVAGLDRILDTGASLVVLGTGLPKYEEFLRAAARRHRGRVAVELKYDNALAHLIEAGADLFLMPSLYEPCGLNQMYSLRYGTVPVVRRTGGLADTVTDDDARGAAAGGVGFVFDAYTADAMVDAVQRAVAAYHDSPRWARIVKRGMSCDFSWGASARRYLDLYREALERRA
jgi:1,4-alpha-glucan branching enzyme